MSELINKNDNRATIRWKLLTGASALALTAYVSTAGFARAEDADQPQVWIELGGQLSRLQDSVEPFAPAFETMRPAIFKPSGKIDGPPLYGIDEFASLSFQPKDSDWIFSASIKYGRATKTRHAHQQTYPTQLRFSRYPTLYPHAKYATVPPVAARFADTNARNTQQHAILDFQAGKDVGLGLFGKDSSSTLSLGVRFAQFREKSNIALKSDPDWHFKHKYFTYTGILIQTIVQPYHSNAAGLTADRSFRGVGPSLSWNSSMPFAGNAQNGELTFDWGLDVAMLFGRQKTRTQHHETQRYNDGGKGDWLWGLFYNPLRHRFGTQYTVYHHPTNAPAYYNTRSRNVTVPNVGGSVGLSWQLQNFKMSFGYKADFFFNAIDGGIDTRKDENRAFYGPYASISIGLGD